MSVHTAPGHELSPADLPSRPVPALFVWLPLLVGLVAVAGSLGLSLALELKACPLCLYQRTFVMGVVSVLAVGVLVRRHWGVLNLVALPGAVAALGVAVFHVYLELTGKLECPGGFLGVGTAPQQSLVVLAVLLVVMLLGIFRGRDAGVPAWPALAGVVVGLFLAAVAVASAPPMPAAPTSAYTTPLDVCRPPYRLP